MSDIKQDFEVFEEFLKVYMKSTKVRNITRRYFSSKKDDYNNYTIEQFLITYKLDRMEELGVVTSQVSDKLKEILDIKKRVDELITDEARKALYMEPYDVKALTDLHKLSDVIDNHLKKYHLTIEDINLKEMIDASIKTENNELEQDNNRIRRMD